MRAGIEEKESVPAFLVFGNKSEDIISLLFSSCKKMKKLVVIGVPMALQFSITAIGSIILQSAVNTLGKTAVASMTAAIKIQTVAVGPMESMGITMATYCGQNRGARKYSRITAGIGQSIAMTMVYSVAACAAVSFLGGALTTLFIDKNTADSENIQKIIDLSVYYLRINGLFYPFLGVLFIIRNSLQGMGYSMLPMLAGVSELAARSLVAILFVSSIGYTAVCLASPVAWIFADVVLLITYTVKIKELKNVSMKQLFKFCIE